jgi:hypothetical protein
MNRKAERSCQVDGDGYLSSHRRARFTVHLCHCWKPFLVCLISYNIIWLYMESKGTSPTNMFLLNQSTYWSRNSSVGMAVVYGLEAGARLPVWARYLFLLHSVQIGSGAHPISLIQCVTWTLSSAVQRPWREANNSPTYSVEAKNGGAISPLLHTS